MASFLPDIANKAGQQILKKGPKSSSKVGYSTYQIRFTAEVRCEDPEVLSQLKVPELVTTLMEGTPCHDLDLLIRCSLYLIVQNLPHQGFTTGLYRLYGMADGVTFTPPPLFMTWPSITCTHLPMYWEHRCAPSGTRYSHFMTCYIEKSAEIMGKREAKSGKHGKYLTRDEIKTIGKKF